MRERIDIKVIDQNLVGRDFEHGGDFLVHALDVDVKGLADRLDFLRRNRNHRSSQGVADEEDAFGTKSQLRRGLQIDRARFQAIG